MNVHHLELFYYVAKHGGISEACRKIPYGVQQPAVSTQMGRLEEDLGARLFERRPFRLTDEGRLVFIEANPNSDLTPHTLGTNLCFVGIEYKHLIPRIVETARKRYRKR